MVRLAPLYLYVVLGLLLCAMEVIPVFEHGLGIPKGR